MPQKITSLVFFYERVRSPCAPVYGLSFEGYAALPFFARGGVFSRGWVGVWVVTWGRSRNAAPSPYPLSAERMENS